MFGRPSFAHSDEKMRLVDAIRSLNGVEASYTTLSNLTNLEVSGKLPALLKARELILREDGIDWEIRTGWGIFRANAEQRVAVASKRTQRGQRQFRKGNRVAKTISDSEFNSLPRRAQERFVIDQTVRNVALDQGRKRKVTKDDFQKVGRLAIGDLVEAAKAT